MLRRSFLLAGALALFAPLASVVAGDDFERALRLREAPELSRVTRWINSEPLTLKGLRGKVVVVHFWTNGCSNCINNYPHYRSWQERYAGRDVVMVGIHTPETEGERDIDRIRRQAEKNGLKFPIAVDNDGANWRAWKNQYWPTVYVVDRRGAVRYGWEGELNFNGQEGEEAVRRAIDGLLAEKAPGPDDAPKQSAPPKVGDIAADFTLRSLGGDEVRLSDAAAKGPVALVVLRGFPGYQCPLCTAQVADLTARAKAFAERDARVILVYPGPADALRAHAEEFLQGKAFPENFDLVLDPDYAFTNAYGLRWDAPNETAYPSTFVIDRDRKVRFAKVSRTHGGRVKATEVLEALPKTR